MPNLIRVEQFKHKLNEKTDQGIMLFNRETVLDILYDCDDVNAQVVHHAHWKYWEGWPGNHDKRIDDATCSNCGYKHPTVYGSTDSLYDSCPVCRCKMSKTGEDSALSADKSSEKKADCFVNVEVQGGQNMSNKRYYLIADGEEVASVKGFEYTSLFAKALLDEKNVQSVQIAECEGCESCEE